MKNLGRFYAQNTGGKNISNCGICGGWKTAAKV
jgi:hypothetical protein